MQGMELLPLRIWWFRLLQRVGLRSRGRPAWGEGAPTILGVCSACGAVVLQGWHQETPEGLLCRRCAGKG